MRLLKRYTQRIWCIEYHMIPNRLANDMNKKNATWVKAISNKSKVTDNNFPRAIGSLNVTNAAIFLPKSLNQKALNFSLIPSFHSLSIHLQKKRQFSRTLDVYYDCHYGAYFNTNNCRIREKKTNKTWNTFVAQAHHFKCSKS